MSKVLIVSRTGMKTKHCVGGLELDTRRSLRLLTERAHNQDSDCDYKVGQIWDCSFKDRKDIEQPHTEDVLVSKEKYVKTYSKSLSKLIKEKCIDSGLIWKEPSELFNGTLLFKPNGRGYISKKNVPNLSTGYWLLGESLSKTMPNNKACYKYAPQNNVEVVATYSGLDKEVPKIIDAGTLVRVSLARWWTGDSGPNGEERCYLQISGWYE